MGRVEALIDGVSDNLRLIVVVGGGYVAGVEAGVISGGYPAVPQLPGWWDLAALVTVAVVIVSWFVGSKLADLLPDPRGHIIVALDAKNDERKGVWELNDVAWDQLRIQGGRLYPWTESPFDVYEAVIYNEETNAVVCNWKEAVPDSAFRGETDADAVQERITELREVYEQDGRYARALRRRFSGILRRLDAQRAMDQNAALEGHLSPSFGEESIDDIIHQMVPEEALPPHLQSNGDDGALDLDDVGGQGQVEGDFVGFDLLDGGEELEPTGPLANDGGTVDAE